MKGKSALTVAKKTKDDEFYTRLADIENELKHYKKHFEDKVIFCNCDDPEWSNFWKYFSLNFDYLKIRKLIATHYELEKESYKLMMYRDDSGVHTEIKRLKGNGDFRSQESVGLMEEADIIVTNPPFSLFREYVAQLMEHNKKFIIIGNKNAIPYKDFFPLLKDNKIWIGYSTPSEFTKPDGTITKKVNGLCRWYTNLDIQKRHEDILLYKEYNENEYYRYEDYDAIEVKNVKEIPKDYFGMMGVPITFLDYYNPEQFEIIDCHEPCIDVEMLKTNPNFKEYKSRQKTYNDKLCQKTYHRIFIKKKVKKADE